MRSVKKKIGRMLTKAAYDLKLLRCRLYIKRKGCVEDVVYKNREIKLYLSEYNCGVSCRERLTERALELALAKEWTNMLNDEYIEIGAVTPYYEDGFSEHSVIDPADAHERVDIKKSLFECDYFGKNILSISTIEHVGTGDFGLTKAEDCTDALNKILRECKSCLISFPMGYNKKLDMYVVCGGFSKWLLENQIQVSICVYVRNKYGNDWRLLREPEKHYTEYAYGPLWANCVCFIEK